MISGARPSDLVASRRPQLHMGAKARRKPRRPSTRSMTTQWASTGAPGHEVTIVRADGREQIAIERPQNTAGRLKIPDQSTAAAGRLACREGCVRTRNRSSGCRRRGVADPGRGRRAPRLARGKTWSRPSGKRCRTAGSGRACPPTRTGGNVEGTKGGGISPFLTFADPS